MKKSVTLLIGFSFSNVYLLAQSNIYSANIVGYVAITNPAGQYLMLANPLDNGANDLASLLPAVPNGTVVQVFQGGALQPSTKNKGTWSQNYIVPPGTGFFFNSPFSGTNIFVGEVAGFTNSIALQAGVIALVGSPLPFSGNLSDRGVNTLNFDVLPNGSIVYRLVNGVLQPATKIKGTWGGSSTLVNPGDGFYMLSPVTTNIIQILNPQ